MSKQFAMLAATRRLENYLSREAYHLRRMETNNRVPQSLLEAKIRHYNELVTAVNDLFSALTDAKESLFPYYNPITVATEDSLANGSPYDSSVDAAVSEPEDVAQTFDAPDENETEETDETEPEEDDTTQPFNESVPEWQASGYMSYEEWLLDKESESAELPSDVALGVNTKLSQYRAAKALNEYQEKSVQDIATYLPEEDASVSVLPTRPTEDLYYLNHTADDVRVNDDPTQIAKVKTAVEMDEERARKAAEINISDYMPQTDMSSLSDIVDEDIAKATSRKGQDETETEEREYEEAEV